MSAEAPSLEGLPLELEPDILLANQFVWHGLQTHFKAGNRQAVQPFLEYRDPMPNPGDVVAEGPIEPQFHPDQALKKTKEPWAYQKELSAYPGHRVKLTTLYFVETNLPTTVAPKVGPSSLVPETIISLAAEDVLAITERTDLDDVERYSLRETHYMFWSNRPALRQDVFDVGDPQKHIVATRAQNDELQTLHDEVFGYSSCFCASCVKVNHYGPLMIMPPEKMALLGLRLG